MTQSELEKTVLMQQIKNADYKALQYERILKVK